MCRRAKGRVWPCNVMQQDDQRPWSNGCEWLESCCHLADVNIWYAGLVGLDGGHWHGLLTFCGMLFSEWTKMNVDGAKHFHTKHCMSKEPGGHRCFHMLIFKNIFLYTSHRTLLRKTPDGDMSIIIIIIMDIWCAPSEMHSPKGLQILHIHIFGCQKFKCTYYA